MAAWGPQGNWTRERICVLHQGPGWGAGQSTFWDLPAWRKTMGPPALPGPVQTLDFHSTPERRGSQSDSDQFSHEPRHWMHKDGLNLLVKSCFLHPRQLWLGKNPSPLYLIYILELHLISIYKGVCEKDNVLLVESVSLETSHSAHFCKLKPAIQTYFCRWVSPTLGLGARQTKPQCPPRQPHLPTSVPSPQPSERTV